jgi:hypothetical protein
MMPTTESERRLAARIKVVDEHIARENQHDLEGILLSFGAMAETAAITQSARIQLM